MENNTNDLQLLTQLKDMLELLRAQPILSESDKLLLDEAMAKLASKFDHMSSTQDENF